MRISHRGHRGLNQLIFLMISVISVANFGCGVPNLETAECTQARDSAKKFYSFHFGNDMRPTADNLKMRERFLTPRYYEVLARSGEGEIDQFTASSDFPRTFKIGECRAATPTKVDLQIQLYWRDDQRTVQQEVTANMAKQDDSWLLDGVSSK